MAAFPRVPPESVAFCAESLGIPCHEDGIRCLSEDVSYRIRQVLNVALHLVHQSRRNNVLSSDLHKGMKWSNVEPTFGSYSSSESSSFHQPDDVGVSDMEQRLGDFVYDSFINISLTSKPVTTSSKWLILEGTALDEEDERGSFNGATVAFKTLPTEAQHYYLSLILDAVTCNREEVRQVALHDLYSNAAVANILPYLCQFIQEVLMRWTNYTSVQIVRFLRMLIALFGNDTLYIDPYAPNILMLIQSIILNPGYLETSASTSHWDVRELAACVLSRIIRKCCPPGTSYYNDLCSVFVATICKQETALPVLYGVVLCVCHLSGEAIAKIILPQMTQLTCYIQSLLDKSSFGRQQSALRVYNVLLVSAELLLVSEVGQSNECLTVDHSLRNMTWFTSQNPLDDIDEELSQYDFLFELYGERLLLKLESYLRVSYKPNGAKPLSQVPPVSIPNVQDAINRSFSLYQKREGFISLSHLISSQRLVAPRKPIHRTQSKFILPFFIKKYRLPVSHNVLDLKHVPGPLSVSSVRTGFMAGHRKPVTTVCDLCSCWL